MTHEELLNEYILNYKDKYHFCPHIEHFYESPYLKTALISTSGKILSIGSALISSREIINDVAIISTINAFENLIKELSPKNKL